MVEKTPRRGLDNYEQGDTNWDHSDLVDDHDELAVERGPITDRPGQGSYDDELYFATDQHILWKWDESLSDWVIEGGKGSPDQPVDELYARKATVAVDAESSKHLPADGSGRQIATTESRDYYIATDGDDSNPGTQQEPLATVQEFFDRIPQRILHQTRCLIEPGSYGNGELVIGDPFYVIGGEPHTDPFSIRSSTGNRDDVELDLDIALCCISNEIDDAFISDVTIHNRITNTGGALHVDNVLFTGQNTSAAINSPTHHPGYTFFTNCTFEPALEYACTSYAGAKTVFDDCDGYVSKYVADCRYGGTVIETNDVSLYGQHGFANLRSSTSYVNRYGKTWGQDVRLSDDWNDGRLQNRFRTGAAGYRPEWVVDNGSPFAVDGAAVFPAGDTTYQGIETDYRMSKMTTGTWRLEYAFQSVPSTGDFQMDFIRKDGASQWWVEITASGSVGIGKTEAGTTSDVISGNISVDTSRHLIEVIRTLDIDGNRSEGVELFIDGTSQGTYADDFVPAPNERRIFNTTDAEVRAYNYVEEPEIQTIR